MDFSDYHRRAPVTLALVALNIVFFLWTEVNGSSEDIQNMYRWGAMYGPAITEDHEYWRLVTAAFLHFGISHIANNMFLLLLMGDRLERALGHVKYLILYLVSAVGANLFSMVLDLRLDPETFYRTVSAGASGAVFGVIGGLLWAVVRNRGRLEDLSARQMMIFAGLSFYYGLTAAGVDSKAHFGGLVTGFVMCMFLYRPKRRGNWAEVWQKVI
ncbi:MAG: rhomboid family intramembrane serine protease [Stomatobaculum sp.]|nr:rhomboid family intramembrane serine protease [Stomatobaculum sp.]